MMLGYTAVVKTSGAAKGGADHSNGRGSDPPGL